MLRFFSWIILVGLMCVILRLLKKSKIRWSFEQYYWPLFFCVLLISLWFSHFRFSLWYLEPWPALASDFLQYCDAVLSAENDLEPRFPQRSPVIAQLTSLSSSMLGIIDGIISINVIAQAVLLCSLAGWSQMVGGRMASLFCFPLALSFVPFTLMSRMLDFYPVYAAAWSLNALLCALSIKHKNPVWAATGAALSLLVDPRGLLWALCSIAVVLYAVVLRRRWFPLFLSFVPLFLSYFIAQVFVPEHTPSLELQAWWFAQERAGELSPDVISWAYEPFVWGQSRIIDIPKTIITLAQSSNVGMLDSHQQGLAQDRLVFVYPKLFLMIVLLLPVLTLKRYRPSRDQALMLILPAIPFILVLLQTSATQVAIRRLLISWPFAVVWLAYGLSRFWAFYSRRFWIPTLFLFVGLWVVNWGRFDPQWYTPMQEPPDVDALYAVHPSANVPTDPGFRDPACEQALRDDLDQGHPWGGRVRMEWPIRADK